MAESIIEETSPPDCFIPEDLLNIRKQSEEVIREFAKDLERSYKKEITRAIAVDVLILGATDVKPNGPCFSKFSVETKENADIKENAERKCKLMPKYLFIKALTAPEDSEQGKNEIKEGKFESLQFLKKVMPDDVDVNVLERAKEEAFKAVEDYDAMKDTVEEFIDTSIKVTMLPIIIFLGHGTPEGELAFLRSWPASRNVLSDMAIIFHTLKPKAMKNCQLRMVFSQCYGHLIDEDPKPSEMRFDGIEYIYFTKPGSDKTTTAVTRQYNPDKYDSLHKMKYDKDVGLQLPSNHLFVTEAVKRLKAAGLADYSDDDLKAMVLNGPDPALSVDKKRNVHAERSKLKKFLQASFTDPSATREGVIDVLGGYIEGFTVVNVHVTSPSALESKIEKFLNSTKDVGMPVVMVSGKGKVVKKYLIVGKSRLKLDFGDTTVDAGRLLAKARAVYANIIDDSSPYALMDLRMVFSCYDASGEQLLFSNAVLPEVVDAKRRELQEYAYVVVGDSNHNKTGIDLNPDPDVDP